METCTARPGASELPATGMVSQSTSRTRLPPGLCAPALAARAYGATVLGVGVGARVGAERRGATLGARAAALAVVAAPASSLSGAIGAAAHP